MLVPSLVLFIVVFLAVIGWQRHETSGATPAKKAFAVSALGIALLAMLAIAMP